MERKGLIEGQNFKQNAYFLLLPEAHHSLKYKSTALQTYKPSMIKVKATRAQVFEAIFRDPEAAAQAYSRVHSTHYGFHG